MKNKAKDIVDFVSTWIDNPASSYSHDALNGLFGMTRDMIANMDEEPHHSVEMDEGVVTIRFQYLKGSYSFSVFGTKMIGGMASLDPDVAKISPETFWLNGDNYSVFNEEVGKAMAFESKALDALKGIDE